MTDIAALEKAYREANAASEAAKKAMWSNPDNNALRDEFARLFRVRGEARRALEAATGKPTNLYEQPCEYALRAEREMDAAENADAYGPRGR